MMDLNSLLNSARNAFGQDRLTECANLCRQALAIDPANVQAMLLLGVTEAKGGDPQTAVDLLTKVEQLDKTSFQAPFWLSIAHRRLGQKQAAVQAAERAVEKNPKDAQGLAQLGMCCLDARLLPEAESSFREAARIAPGVVQIMGSLAHSLALQGKVDESAKVLDEILTRSQFSAESLVKFGQMLLSQEFQIGAAAFARAALAKSPRSPKALMLLARALIDQNRVPEAIEHLRFVVELEPENADAIAMLGSATQALGEIQEASRLFRRSLDLNPGQGYAYLALFYNRKVVEADRPDMARMQELISDGNLAPSDLSYLHYGLAKAHENLEEFEESMAHYDSANAIEHALKFKDRQFDRKEYAGRTDRIISRFTADFLAQRRAFGSENALPIFVVGMPRSGTTLVEQILSSHPEVGGAGEQLFWPDNWRLAMDSTDTEVSREGLKTLARRYSELLQKLAPGNSRVVDKMPGNRSGLGLIHLTFPNARIIHTRRHPVDTCLSIYATPNRAHTEFAHNRDNIVFAYREYQRMMEHWRKMLPAECFMEVDYEELVTNGEHVIREMVAFSGLPWSDQCLTHQDNARTVITPSVWQVRQPMYRTSMERWRKFQPWLGSFCDLLEP